MLRTKGGAFLPLETLQYFLTCWVAWSCLFISKIEILKVQFEALWTEWVMLISGFSVSLPVIPDSDTDGSVCHLYFDPWWQDSVQHSMTIAETSAEVPKSFCAEFPSITTEGSQRSPLPNKMDHSFVTPDNSDVKTAHIFAPNTEAISKQSYIRNAFSQKE